MDRDEQRSIEKRRKNGKIFVTIEYNETLKKLCDSISNHVK